MSKAQQPRQDARADAVQAIREALMAPVPLSRHVRLAAAKAASSNAARPNNRLA